MNARVKVYGLVLAAMGIVGIGAWIGVNGEPQQPSAAAAPKPVLTVSVVEAQHKAVDDNIHVIGMTLPREDVVVIPEQTGLRVHEVYVEAGDYVRQGQKLALLDSASLQIQLKGLQTEYERTREEYSRAKAMLLSSGAVSKEVLIQRQAAFEVAQSRLQDAELSIHRTQIVAPTSGFIYARTAAIGGVTNGSEPLFRIAKDGEVEMEASVPEAMMRRLRVAMPAVIEIAGNAPVTGSVRLIAPRVDSTSRAAGVRISFKRDGVTPVGVFCDATITVAQVDGWVFPGTVLQQDTQGMYVWSVNSKHSVQRKPVTVVLRTPDNVVVQEFLGDMPLVAKAGSFLKEGDLVEIARLAAAKGE